MFSHASARSRAPESPTVSASSPTTSAPVVSPTTSNREAADRVGAVGEAPGHEDTFLAGLDSEAEAEVKPGLVLAGNLGVGSRGRDVEALQAWLGIEADGSYGPKTREAVVAWQQENGLEPDGKIGPESLAALSTNARGVDLHSTLRTGATGSEVKRLQRFLGLEADGKFGGDTRSAVIKFQMEHGLEPDGVIGAATREALAGAENESDEPDWAREEAPKAPEEAHAPEEEPVQMDPELKPVVGDGPDEAHTPTPKGELKSRWHDDDKFVPRYASTAYSESSIYRKESDPYAVGAISNPTRRQDLGGKTYGVYQFESSVYRDGSTRGRKAVAGSTASRFANWEGNPYGEEMRAVIAKHGMGSRQFDAMWKQLSADDNKAFGEVQQAFMELENKERMEKFFAGINASDTVREDARMQDLAMGTWNQYSGLTHGMMRHLAANNTEGQLDADALGKMLQDYKRARVKSHFRSSPGAHKGIYNRIARERAMFE